MDAKGKKVRNRIESHDFSGRLSVGDHGEDAVFLGVLAVVLAPRRTEGLCKNAKKISSEPSINVPGPTITDDPMVGLH